MLVRILDENDAAAWWHLRLEALEREPFAFGKDAEEHRVTSVESTALRIRNAPEGSFHLGAFDRDSLIGMATFIRETHRKERHKARIFGVYVTASHRGTGIGRAPIAALLERAKSDPSLERHLYRQFGFEIFGTGPHGLKVGVKYVDEEHMILRLRPDSIAIT